MSVTAQNICCECGRSYQGSGVLGQCPTCLMAAAIGADRAKDADRPRYLSPTRADLERAFPEIEVVECLGKGGMAAVYKVRHRTIDRLAALKILLIDPLDDPIMADRFAAEGEILKCIDHPHVIRAYLAGEHGGFLFILMELVQGPSLRQVLDSGKIPPMTAVYASIQISNGLGFVHQRGYIHRDVKPDNILLHAGSEPFSGALDSFFHAGGRVRLADFGLATSACDLPGSRRLTLPNQRLGTPDYMAPEYRSGVTRPDLRMDVYSLGVMMYELLTGDLPVGRYQLPSRRCAVPPEVDEVILTCMEPEPSRRYADAAEVRQELAKIYASTRQNRSQRRASFGR